MQSQPTKLRVIAEVQVRTIFEEGWSEIDHRMRYPYDQNNLILGAFLGLFNRLSGNADEMGSFINLLKDELDARDEQHGATVKELTEKIRKLEIDTNKKQDLQSGVDRLSSLSHTVAQAVRAMAISPAFVESIKAADASAKIFAAFAAQRALSEMVPPKSVTNKALPPKQFVDSPKLEKVNESKSEDELKEKIVNLTSAKKQGRRSTKKK